MSNMVFKPAENYSRSFDESARTINLVCDCHKCIISGSARRVGLVEVLNYPVYAIESRIHPELDDVRIALTPSGFEQPIKLLKGARI